MIRFLVAGIVQMETIVKVDKLPISYQSLNSKPDTIYSGVGGDAYNMANALKWLGNDVDLMSMVSRKVTPEIVNLTLKNARLGTDYVLPALNQMPSAVNLYDCDGKQQIFEDTKDLGQTVYNPELMEIAVDHCDVLVTSNVSFCKPLIELAKERQIPIVVNIRDFRKEDLSFNKEFLDSADIIYVSDDDLEKSSYEFVKEISEIYSPKIVILGCGERGVMMYSDQNDSIVEYRSVKTLEKVNTVGAGNALLSCFLHYYFKTNDPIISIKNALLFASYKIGFYGTSNGFMTEEQIEQWRNIIWNIK
ncbi:MAG: carbohydrate kinase family protein [Lachnospiraceae bacterium]|nr:carbohydrate kinase family protein [Lachnospiraceae bacterium]